LHFNISNEAYQLPASKPPASSKVEHEHELVEVTQADSESSDVDWAEIYANRYHGVQDQHHAFLNFNQLLSP